MNKIHCPAHSASPSTYPRCFSNFGFGPKSKRAQNYYSFFFHDPVKIVYLNHKNTYLIIIFLFLFRATFSLLFFLHLLEFFPQRRRRKEGNSFFRYFISNSIYFPLIPMMLLIWKKKISLNLQENISISSYLFFQTSFQQSCQIFKTIIVVFILNCVLFCLIFSLSLRSWLTKTMS